MVLLQALGEIDVRRRQQFYWAARASFVSSPEQIASFDQVFERFWAGTGLRASEPVAEHGESDARMQGPQYGGESLPAARQGGGSSALVDGSQARASADIQTARGADGEGRRGSQRGVLAAWSPDEQELEPEPVGLAATERAALLRLSRELAEAMPERVSRRPRRVRRGSRLDLRRTLRSSLRYDGELLAPAYLGRSRRPRRLLLICDVSGSMERYSRTLLGSLGAAVAAGIHAEGFVFATRLTRLTGTLSTRDVSRGLERARSEVTDWSGGTRIGAALREFNAHWGRLGLARGSIVIVVSDGWDRGDPELLAAELERLRRQARRLTWLNPRPLGLDEQPLAVGLRAARPHVDELISGHDVRVVDGLASLIAGLGRGRPSRRQRAFADTDASRAGARPKRLGG